METPQTALEEKYAKFWNWFQTHEKEFYHVTKKKCSRKCSRN